MITLGYIESLPEKNSNLFKVKIPIFSQPGMGDIGTIFSANLCYNPGNLNSYRKGDCVVLGFLGNKIEEPIILGKLYTTDEEEATNFSLANSLVVTTKADLPYNTNIGGVCLGDLVEQQRKLGVVSVEVSNLDEDARDVEAALIDFNSGSGV